MASLFALILCGSAADATHCHVFPGKTVGTEDIMTVAGVANAGVCCDLCTANDICASWTYHQPPTSSCWLKANTEDSGRPVDKHNNTCSGLRIGPVPGPPSPYACGKGFDHFPFCDVSLPVEQRVADLVGRINDTDKPNLLTARGLGGKGDKMQAIPALGVPAYYWGTNCLHSMNGGSCVVDSHNVSRCPTNFPSGPSFGATFDRSLVRQMAGVVGTELRAMFALRLGAHYMSLDCWGPVVVRDSGGDECTMAALHALMLTNPISLSLCVLFAPPPPSESEP